MIAWQFSGVKETFLEKCTLLSSSSIGICLRSNILLNMEVPHGAKC